MAKSLLRSGNLDDYQAVGGGGQAVFESALQIRETRGFLKSEMFSQSAISQRSFFTLLWERIKDFFVTRKDPLPINI